MAAEWWAVGLVVFATLVGAGGPILLKRGSGALSRNPFKLLNNFSLICGVGCYALSSLIFIPALRGGDLSVLYPLVSIGYIWVSILSMKFLGEKMGSLKWVGIALIIVGVSLIGLGS